MAVGPLTAILVQNENAVFNASGFNNGTAFTLTIANAGATSTNLSYLNVSIYPPWRAFNVGNYGAGTLLGQQSQIPATSSLTLPIWIEFLDQQIPGATAAPQGGYTITVSGSCSDGSTFVSVPLNVVVAPPVPVVQNAIVPGTQLEAPQIGQLDFRMFGAPGQLQNSNSSLFLTLF